MEMVILTYNKKTNTYSIPEEYKENNGEKLEIERVFLNGEFCDKRLYVFFDRWTICFDVKLGEDTIVTAIVKSLND